MRKLLFVLASATTLVIAVPSSAQYGAPQGGVGAGLPYGNNGQWRNNNWRDGYSNDWRSNNWREDRTEDWRRNNWREDRTDDWRPHNRREDKSKDNVENNTKTNNAYDDDCRRAPNSPDSHSNAPCR